VSYNVSRIHIPSLSLLKDILKSSYPKSLLGYTYKRLLASLGYNYKPFKNYFLN